MVGKFQLKLNMDKKPIANKYREGKMKSTLKRESKGLEIVNRETFEIGDYHASIVHGAANNFLLFHVCCLLCDRSMRIVESSKRAI